MRKLVAVLVSVVFLTTLVAMAQPGIFQILPSVVQPRLAYSVDPPWKISVEIQDVTLYVDLRKQGQLQLNAQLPQAGSQYGIGAVLINICSEWDLHGTYPGAVYYQVRPSLTQQAHWVNYALQVDVPSLLWGTPIGTGVHIIPAARFGSMAPASEKYGIVPSANVELGPAAMQGQASEPYVAEITFPTVHLEWFEWSQTARYRAGNVVLQSNAGFHWDQSNPNGIYIGNLHIDLHTGVVSYVNWRAGGTMQPTLLQVIIDDSDSGMIPLEPDLWW